MKKPTKAQIQRFERKIKADIYWVVKYGPGFNPRVGAKRNGTWHASGSLGHCGTCAIGAHCLHIQPDVDTGVDSKAVAQSLGMPWSWVTQVYYGILDAVNPRDFPAKERYTSYAVAARLAEYGDDLMQKRHQLLREAELEHEKAQKIEHEEAQRDQLTAEKLGL